MKPRRRKAAVVALTSIATVALTACQYLPNVALRLNEDGTLDFGSCESVSSILSIEAEVYIRTDDDQTVQNLLPPVPAHSLSVGDVLHLGTAPPAEEWDRTHISVQGDDVADNRRIWGIFDRSELTPGEWSWAKSESNPFDRATHCELND